MLKETDEFGKAKRVCITNEMLDFADYQRYLFQPSSELIEVPASGVLLMENGMTDFPGRLGALGDLGQNIPVLRDVEHATGTPVLTSKLKTILLSNLHLVSYYFRTHVLLRQGIFEEIKTPDIPSAILNVLSPLVTLHNCLYPNQPIPVPALDSDTLLESLYSFERMLHRLYEFHSRDEKTSEVEIQGSPRTLTDVIRQIDVLPHSRVLKGVMDELSTARDAIKEIIIYGSIAKGTATAASDIDVLVILQDLIQEESTQLYLTLSAIIRANSVIRNNAELKKKEPVHYLFERETGSIPHIYRNEIFHHAVRVRDPNEVFITKAHDEYDDLYLRTALINKCQKVRHEAATILHLDDSLSTHAFLERLSRHMHVQLETLTHACLRNQNEKQAASHSLSQLDDIDTKVMSNEEARKRIEQLVELHTRITKECYGI